MESLYMTLNRRSNGAKQSLRLTLLLTLVAFFCVSCSSGGDGDNAGGGNSTGTSAGNGEADGGNNGVEGVPSNPNGPKSPVPLVANDKTAARLLAQASFGASAVDIEKVKALGLEEWIDNQFTIEGNSHFEYSNSRLAKTSDPSERSDAWWLNAVDGEDQLRGRVAFALSQIFVVSEKQQTLGNAQLGLTQYYDLLRQHAFGNYRDLLYDTTKHPVMGVYLSMMQNAKANPVTNTRADENFAREVMQLFSIGLHELNLDGTQKLVNGKPIPTYTLDDVAEYARVFTGWGEAVSQLWDAHPLSQYANFLLPMEPYPEYHDTGEKKLLGGVVSPAGISAEEDLNIAIDSLFNHPNVGPFISKQLIQRLVTSNPSPEYVARVAGYFNDNGLGVRGDLRTVVKAILVDEEARFGHEKIDDFGKLREPLIRLTHLWRAFDAKFSEDLTVYSTNAPQLKNVDSTFGQAPMGANSVFNFYHPDYSPIGQLRDAKLLAPEAEIYTEDYILTTNTYINTYIQKFYDAGEGDDGAAKFQTYLDIRPQVETAKNPAAFIDELNRLMLAGQMTNDMRTILTEHMEALPDTVEGRAQRVRDGITLVMASPAYLVQK